MRGIDFYLQMLVRIIVILVTICQACGKLAGSDVLAPPGADQRTEKTRSALVCNERDTGNRNLEKENRDDEKTLPGRSPAIICCKGNCTSVSLENQRSHALLPNSFDNETQLELVSRSRTQIFRPKMKTDIGCV